MSKDEEAVFRKVSQLGYNLKPTPHHFLQPLVLPSQQPQHGEGRSPTGSPSYTISATALPGTAYHGTTQLSGGLWSPGSPNTTLRSAPGQLLATTGAVRTGGKTSRGSSPQTTLLPLLSPRRLVSAPSASVYLDVNTAVSAIQRGTASPTQTQELHQPRLAQPSSPSRSSPLRPTSTNQQLQTLDSGRPSTHNVQTGNPITAGAPGSVDSGNWSQPSRGRAATASSLSPKSLNRRPGSCPAQPSPSSPLGWQSQQQLPKQDLTRCSSPDISKDLGTAKALRRRKFWDSNTNLPSSPSFEAALQAWQSNLEAGVYGPRFLGSWNAVSSGHVTAATAAAHRSISPVVSSVALTDGRAVSPKVAAMPAVFQGSGEEAVQALEQLVQQLLVAKPHLTLLQLQRGVQAVSQLEVQYQLAATGIMLRGGCWTAAMQVGYADLSDLAEVLVEMRSIIETVQQWDRQDLTAATWFWSPIDRDLFMRSFRGLGLVSQYQQLRKQLTRLNPSSSTSTRPGQSAALGASTAMGQAASAMINDTNVGTRSSSRVDNCHPVLAKAECMLLLSVIDDYLANVDAALAAQAAAAAEKAVELQQQGYSVMAVLDELSEFGAPQAGGSAESTARGSGDGEHAVDSMSSEMTATLQIGSDWKILSIGTGVAQTEQHEQQDDEQESSHVAQHNEASDHPALAAVDALATSTATARLSAGSPRETSGKLGAGQQQPTESTNEQPAAPEPCSLPSVPAGVVLGPSEAPSSSMKRGNSAAAMGAASVAPRKQQARRNTAEAALSPATARAGNAVQSVAPFDSSISASAVLAMQQVENEEQQRLTLIDEQEQTPQTEQQSGQHEVPGKAGSAEHQHLQLEQLRQPWEQLPQQDIAATAQHEQKEDKQDSSHVAQQNEVGNNTASATVNALATSAALARLSASSPIEADGELGADQRQPAESPNEQPAAPEPSSLPPVPADADLSPSKLSSSSIKRGNSAAAIGAARVAPSKQQARRHTAEAATSPATARAGSAVQSVATFDSNISASAVPTMQQLENEKPQGLTSIEEQEQTPEIEQQPGQHEVPEQAGAAEHQHMQLEQLRQPGEQLQQRNIAPVKQHQQHDTEQELSHIAQQNDVIYNPASAAVDISAIGTHPAQPSAGSPSEAGGKLGAGQQQLTESPDEQPAALEPSSLPSVPADVDLSPSKPSTSSVKRGNSAAAMGASRVASSNQQARRHTAEAATSPATARAGSALQSIAPFDSKVSVSAVPSMQQLENEEPQGLASIDEQEPTPQIEHQPGQHELPEQAGAAQHQHLQLEQPQQPREQLQQQEQPQQLQQSGLVIQEQQTTVQQHKVPAVEQLQHGEEQLEQTAAESGTASGVVSSADQQEQELQAAQQVQQQEHKQQQQEVQLEPQGSLLQEDPTLSPLEATGPVAAEAKLVQQSESVAESPPQQQVLKEPQVQEVEAEPPAGQALQREPSIGNVPPPAALPAAAGETRSAQHGQHTTAADTAAPALAPEPGVQQMVPVQATRTGADVHNVSDKATKDMLGVRSGTSNLETEVSTMKAELCSSLLVQASMTNQAAGLQPDGETHQRQQPGAATRVGSKLQQDSHPGRSDRKAIMTDNGDVAAADSTPRQQDQLAQQQNQLDQQQNQLDQQPPDVPSEPCNRPQSHQTRRRNSMLSSRPASAQVRLNNAADILREAGLSAVISRSRPASAAAATAAEGLGATSWSRPGTAGGAFSSASRPSRPQSAAAGDSRVQRLVLSSRPGSAAAGVHTSSSTPRSARAGDATEVGLQRLRDSCAEQRKTLEQVVQNMIAAGDSTAAQLPPAAAVTAMPGSSTASSSPRQWSRSGFGSRPHSGHRYSGISAAGLAGSTLIAEDAAAAAQLEEGSTSLVTASGQEDNMLDFSPRLQIVPEEDSKFQLGLEASQIHRLSSDHSAAGGNGAAPQCGVEVLAEQVPAAAGTQPAHQIVQTGAGTESQPRVQSAQKALPEDLQRTMQLFQQRLEQTALMAQQLLAQQVANQAARTGRATNSRPGSPAVPAQRSAAAAEIPVSEGVRVAGLGGTIASNSSTGVDGLGFGLTPRKPAELGVEDVPSADEVAEYANYLGINPVQDADLLYIAEGALTAPCPDGWTIHLDKEGNEFFFNAETQVSTYEHPMDEHYRHMYQERKQQKMQQQTLQQQAQQ